MEVRTGATARGARPEHYEDVTMCGRFTQNYTWREVQELYGLVGAARNLQPRYNIAPTDSIDVVMPSKDGPVLVPMRWGLIPSWWKKTAKEVPSTFNARAESVAEKPMFRSAFKHNRCIIPASGYFEWMKMPDGKQPYFINAGDGGVLSIAGLWDRWHSKDTGEAMLSCTMIITDANALTRAVSRPHAGGSRSCGFWALAGRHGGR